MNLSATDAMLDLETLGLAPGSAFFQIGWALFNDKDNPSKIVSGCIHVDLASAMEHLAVDADTIKWWMRQSDEARAQFQKAGVPLAQAILHLDNVLHEAAPKRVWANSPNFDIVLLEAAYRKLQRKPYWNHKMLYDVHTLVNLSKVNKAPSQLEHSAEEDAVAQAIDVMNAMKALELV